MHSTLTARRTLTIAAAAVALLALAGCSSGGAGGSGSDGSTPATSASPAPASGGSDSSAVLTTATTSLGTVVVDGKGLTVYVFDKDTQNSGASSCSGACAGQWPAVEADSATPDVTGVTGTVGTIAGVNGKMQVTLDGWPLYTYVGDSSAGDTTGQGVGGIWWVVTPGGAKIGATTGATSTPTDDHGSNSGNDGYNK